MAELRDFAASTEEQSRIARIVWALFNSEKDSFKIRIFFFTFDAADQVRAWLTAKFGPDPLAG